MFYWKLDSWLILTAMVTISTVKMDKSSQVGPLACIYGRAWAAVYLARLMRAYLALGLARYLSIFSLEFLMGQSNPEGTINVGQMHYFTASFFPSVRQESIQCLFILLLSVGMIGVVANKHLSFLFVERREIKREEKQAWSSGRPCLAHGLRLT
ncbi:short chain dehydrogenase family protein [Striga asiatica]|uniref:Short chain dehydrogenase family protein n=1 Tax=Striga asiatica TaxID=4170 RepID=A0A5A7PXB0_STRAF|nr:short chain dehydrogenase family protein [Striga asiatica]